MQKYQYSQVIYLVHSAKDKSKNKYSGRKNSGYYNGLLMWEVDNNNGYKHSIKMKNSLWPTLTIYLLCPQHWSKQEDEKFPTKLGTWCIGCEDNLVPSGNKTILEIHGIHLSRVMWFSRWKITIVTPFLPGKKITIPKVSKGKTFNLRGITDHHP